MQIDSSGMHDIFAILFISSSVSSCWYAVDSDTSLLFTGQSAATQTNMCVVWRVTSIVPTSDGTAPHAFRHIVEYSKFQMNLIHVDIDVDNVGDGMDINWWW